MYSRNTSLDSNRDKLPMSGAGSKASGMSNASKSFLKASNKSLCSKKVNIVIEAFLLLPTEFGIKNNDRNGVSYL